MGATCSQPRETRKIDLYADKRIWSTYSLENREEIEEEYEEQTEKRKSKKWPGVYGFQHEVIKLEKGCFASAEESVDDGFIHPGSGLGTEALGYDKDGNVIHGVARTNNYAEVHTGLSGERVMMKYTHELVWFDEDYDQNNLRRTKDMGKLRRRGDESDEEAQDPRGMVFGEDDEDEEPEKPEEEDSEEANEPEQENAEEEEPVEDDEAKKALMAGAPEDGDEVSEDSDMDAVESDGDDHDIREMLSPDYELRIDSPRSKYRVVSAVLEGMDEVRGDIPVISGVMWTYTM